MKKVLFLLAVASFLAVSCYPISVDNPSNEQQPEKEAEVVQYFVKYASDGTSGKYSVSYTDETGKRQSFSNMSGENFERVVGPVSKGFEAAFSITPQVTSAIFNARIEIKKGCDPFVVKTEKVGSTGGYALSVTYTVE